MRAPGSDERIRPLEERDLPVLRAMYDEAGLAFEWPDLEGPEYVEAQVVVDEADRPLMMAVARMVPEIVLIAGKQHPAAKLRWLRLLHEGMAKVLTARGCTEANCFVPDEIAQGFGRRLTREFGWLPNRASFLIRRKDG